MFAVLRLASKTGFIKKGALLQQGVNDHEKLPGKGTPIVDGNGIAHGRI